MRAIKKGTMEVWQVVLIILSVLLLLFMVYWIGILGIDLQQLMQKLGSLF